MRMRNVWLACVTALMASAISSVASAQTDYETGLQQARREMFRAERGDRFTLTAERCVAGIEARDPGRMKPWCNLATDQAIETRAREQRAAFTEPEQALLLQAAWVNAVDGLPELALGQNRHPIETVPLGGEADTLRASAYRILADLRSHRTNEIWRSFQALMRHLQIPLRRDDTMESVRRRLLDTLLSAEHTPERLWAAAAVALTSEYEFPAGQTLERLQRESAEIALRVEPLRAETANLSGRDAALAPLMAYAHARQLQQARQRLAAARVYGEGDELCTARLWASSDLCMELDYLGVLAAHLAQDEIDHPELANLPYPRKLQGQMRGVAYTEDRCRVITVGDINDMGALDNLRVIYRIGPSSCLQISNEYVETLRYPPVGDANPGERRQGIVVNFQLRSE